MTRLTDEQIIAIASKHGYNHPAVSLFARAIEAAVLAANPQVPREPTEAMLEALCDRMWKDHTAQGVWRAMYDAYDQPAATPAQKAGPSQEGAAGSAADPLRADVAVLELLDRVAAGQMPLPNWRELCADAAALIRAQAERIAELEDRLEYWATDGAGNRVRIESPSCDGIACRDETIRLQDERIKRAEAERDEAFRVIAECAKRVGAIAEPDCSMDLKRMLPGEISIRLAKVQRERDAATKDAERYRFLRNFKCTSDFYADVDRWSVSRELNGWGESYHGTNLDAAIDAALADPRGEK